MSDIIDIGFAFQVARAKKAMTCREVAKAIEKEQGVKISASTINRIENYKAVPSLRIFQTLCIFYGLSADMVMRLEVEK